MMQFRILNTFADSLMWLPADEQKAAKTTAFDLGLAPAVRGLQFHRLDGCTGKNFGFVWVDARASHKAALKAEINKESESSRSFRPPKSDRIAVKVISHLGDEVMKVFRVKEMLA